MANPNDRKEQNPQQDQRKPAAPGSAEKGTNTNRDQDGSASSRNNDVRK